MSADRFYVDASIIAGLVLGDLDFDPILAAISDTALLTYSDFGFGEVVSAIAARVRLTRGTDEEADRQVRNVARYLIGWDHARYLPNDLDRAIALHWR